MTKEKDKTTKKEMSEDVKELVIARLDVLPSNKKVSIGGEGEFSKDDLIEHVRREDNVGRTVVEAELTYLKALKEGELLDAVLASD